MMFNGGILNSRRMAFWFRVAMIGAMLGAGPAGADLLVTDYTNDVVKRYNSSTGAFISDWPGGYKRADAPRGIEFSPDGTEFFVSSTRYPKKYVLKYNASTGSYVGVLVNEPHEDLYLAPNGWLYATGSHSIQGSLYRYNPATGAGGYLGVVSGGSSGVTMGWDGDLYVTNYGANTISRHTQFGQNLGVVISGVGNSGVGGVTFGPDGHIYAVANEGATAGYVYKYNGWDYQFMRKYPVGAKGLTDIEFGPDGWLYVASFDDGRIRRMSTITGAVSDFVAPGSGGLGMPWNIAFTPSAGSGTTILGEPQPVGDKKVRLNVVEVVGDPGAKTTSLGSVHGLNAQSVGGIGAVTKTNTVRRNFEFNAEGGGSDPMTVFLNGTLEGQLLSDNLGRAKVTAKIEILDLDSVSLGSYSKEVSVNSLWGSQHNADVFEQMGIAVELTPGETYEMLSTLTVFADGGLSGGARAFFDNTFTAEFGETLLPEPTSLMLLALGAGAMLRRRRP
jgi:hypothetical protein